MAKYAYLLFNIAVGSSLVFAAVWVPAFWRQWRGIVCGLALVSVPFIIWDALAAQAGHWQFSQTYTLGINMWGLPLEEILFFITVPLGCMVVWILLGRVHNATRPLTVIKHARWLLLSAIPVLMGLAVLAGTPSYTRLALVAAAITCVVLSWHGQLVVSGRFMVFQLCSFALFLVCNTILTGLPVIMYGAQAVTGWKVGTIPVEDFLYNFALLNLFLVAYMGGGRPASKSGQTAVL